MVVSYSSPSESTAANLAAEAEAVLEIARG